MNWLVQMPDGWIKYTITFLCQVFLAYTAFISKNLLLISIVIFADLLVILYFVYKKIKEDLQKDFDKRLNECKESSDKIIEEKNTTIAQLQRSLGIKKGNSTSIRNLAEPENNN